MKLKNHSTYFNKILDYAKSVGIDIIFYTKLNNAYYQPYGKKIYIDPEIKGSDQIAILLHELGHFEDEVFTSDKKVELLYQRAAYKCDEDIPLSKREFNCLIGCELNAWNHGAIIAKKLKIPTGKWYKKIQDKSIATYFETKTKKGVKE